MEEKKDLVMIAGYPLQQLRDYAARDRLLSQLFQQQVRDGIPSSVAGRFTVLFDSLIGLTITKGLTSPQVEQRFGALREEFGCYHQFETLSAELESLFRGE